MPVEIGALSGMAAEEDAALLELELADVDGIAAPSLAAASKSGCGTSLAIGILAAACFSMEDLRNFLAEATLPLSGVTVEFSMRKSGSTMAL